jgi:spore coat polysaccharide biosynthesis protein SpsF
MVNVFSDEVFDDEQFTDRTDLRLTLDEAADYRLLKRVYDEIEYTDTIPIRSAITHIDETGLAELNEAVRQKKV